MERLFKKSFRFKVDNFEEWENQQCKNKGMLDSEIIAYVSDNSIMFKLTNVEDLDIVDTIVMDLNSPFTQILQSKGSLLVSSDRIQYFGGMSDNPKVPHICHLFCEYGRISYIRFAFPTPDSNPFMPMTKRIYEFYGDMTELGELSDETLNMISGIHLTNNNPIPQTEQYVNQALSLANQGYEGDEVYHPLYRAWREFQSDPAQLQEISNYGSYGTGLLRFLLFNTIEDIDTIQQIASVSYLFLTKALEETPEDLNLYIARLLLIQQAREAFQYTVSSVVDEGKSIFSMSMFPFTSRDALYKMEYADLITDSRIYGIDIFGNRKRDLDNKIANNFFAGKEQYDIIREGRELHKKVLNYLNNKVLVDEDVDF